MTRGRSGIRETEVSVANETGQEITKFMELRDYQLAAVESILKQFSHGRKSVLYQLPTAGGKTSIFSHIAREMAGNQKSVCCIVHRKELLDQVSNRLACEHGRICAGSKFRSPSLIQVATIQSLVNRLATYKFDYLIFDECHHCLTPSSMEVIAANRRAKVLGVTATTERLDGRPLGKVFDVLIPGPSVAELTERGFLCRAEVYAPKLIDTAGIEIDRMTNDFAKKPLEKAANKPQITGCAITHYKKLAAGLPALVSCVSRKHSEDTAASFRFNGISAQAVDGNTPRKERAEALRRLANGELEAVMYCELFGEGVDVPIVGCIIDLRPTQSKTKMLQGYGRGLRVATGKESVIILDHVDNINRFFPKSPTLQQICGFYHNRDVCEWTLNGFPGKSDGAPAQKQIDRATCPICSHIYSQSSTCPKCGYESQNSKRELAEREGMLYKVSKDTLHNSAASDVLDELKRLAEEKGFRPEWAESVWRSPEYKIPA